MSDVSFPTCAARSDPAIPATPAGQAAYMAALAEEIARHGAGPVPAAAIADICRAVAVIGRAVARADEAYVRGLADGARARRAAAQAIGETNDG